MEKTTQNSTSKKMYKNSLSGVERKVHKKNQMTSRQRLEEVLNHRPVDRLCVDFGAGGQTGISASALYKLHNAIFGETGYRVKISEPFQMLGKVEEPLRLRLGLDVIGINPRCNMFGYSDEGWKPFELNDGTPVLVPEKFNYTKDEKGNTYMYPEGDTSAQPSAVMPNTGNFFDALNRQKPIDESKLDPADNCEEFGIYSQQDLQHFKEKVDDAYENTDYSVYMVLPGMAFGDIALVPATWMKDPKGIRGVEEWYISSVMRKDYIYKVFEKQCEYALKNVELAAKAVGNKVQVVFVSGTDFGMQEGLFFSKKAYQELYKPFQKAINDKIHELTNWKTFIHSCGAISEIIPDMIEAGFDILNPVQCSAKGMDPKKLKKEYGKDVVFWGGGVDTQSTLSFGTPDDVYREVRDRIDIFSEGGGFVFNSIHNIQANVPTENILAMFKALDDARQQ